MGLKNAVTVKETVDVEIVDSNGIVITNDDGSPIVITVYGPYSDFYKKTMHAQQNKRLAKAQRMGGKMNLTAEELEAGALDLLVKCTKGWKLTLNDGEGFLKFNEENVRKVYTEEPWVRDQVEAVMGDTRAFLG
jgi:hypothetical protein